MAESTSTLGGYVKSLRILIPAIASLLILAAGWAAAETHIVEVRNVEFSPRDITIQKGDIVRWVWIEGIHTTTSGTGAADPDAGNMWDQDCDSANPQFEFTFDDTGLFNYFCRPHEALDMKGTVTVEEGTPTEKLTWGRIKKIFENTAPSSRR